MAQATRMVRPAKETSSEVTVHDLAGWRLRRAGPCLRRCGAKQQPEEGAGAAGVEPELELELGLPPRTAGGVMEANPTTGLSVPGAGPGKEDDLQAESTAEQYASQAVQFA